MRRVMMALAVLALVSVARAAFPPETQASMGSWKEVCCGSLCTGGQDYCIGSGDKTCCKDAEEVELSE
jgi:hypothetical protein